MTPKRLLRIVAVPALAASVAGCGETTETLFVDTTPPGAPTNLVARIDGASVELTWNANSEADLAGYVLERTTDRGQTWEAIGSMLLAPEFEDSLHNSASYRVAALDLSDNQSAYSETAHIVRPPDGDGKNPRNPA